MLAYCWRTGRIDFGRSVPEGAIKIAQGPSKKLKPLICAVARHAYDGKTLLVPGVPEADTDDHAADALERFIDWITPSVAKLQEPR